MCLHDFHFLRHLLARFKQDVTGNANLGVGIPLKLHQYGVTVYAGHHHVKQDQVRLRLPGAARLHPGLLQ